MIPAQAPIALTIEPEATAGTLENPEECANTSCMNDCEDNMLFNAGMTAIKKNIVEVVTNGESEVDVVECVDTGPALPVCYDDPDATEHSSSFGDTFSGSADGLKHDSSDMEVESNGSSSFYGGSSKVFRKRRVSDHWRKYIQPLVWRCRWMELRMKELNYQATKYDRELAVYNQEKQLQMAMTSTDKSAAREVSLTCRSHVKAMKRRKRKRFEETCDIQSYTSNHTIFSYYDKKPEPEGYADDGHGHQAQQDSIIQDDLGVNFEWPMPNVGDFERSLEQLLLGIDSLQSRLFDLTTQLNTTICNSAGEIFSTSGMSVPGEPHYSPCLSPRCSPINDRDAMPFEPVITSPYASELENEDVAMPGSAVSSYGDAAHPDIIESTVDLLSSAIGCGRHQIANLGNEGSDDILINNRAADEELHRFEKANHPTGAPKTLVKEEEDENSARKASSSETETDIEMAPLVERQLPVPRRSSALDGHLRRSKRKRKVRKASPGGWNGEKRRRRKNSKK